MVMTKLTAEELDELQSKADELDSRGLIGIAITARELLAFISEARFAAHVVTIVDSADAKTDAGCIQAFEEIQFEVRLRESSQTKPEQPK
jgi:hypothetical protein